MHQGDHFPAPSPSSLAHPLESVVLPKPRLLFTQLLLLLSASLHHPHHELPYQRSRALRYATAASYLSTYPTDIILTGNPTFNQSPPTFDRALVPRASSLCGGGRSSDEYNMGLHIMALFVVLGQSSFGDFPTLHFL